MARNIMKTGTTHPARILVVVRLAKIIAGRQDGYPISCVVKASLRTSRSFGRWYARRVIVVLHSLTASGRRKSTTF
jgi:hypothetical protein